MGVNYLNKPCYEVGQRSFYILVETCNIWLYVLSGLEDADRVTPTNYPMPQRKQNLTTLSEALNIAVVIFVLSAGGLLVQWRLWAIVSFEWARWMNYLIVLLWC